jgi:ketosteroid isomerase-like protein
MAEADVAVVMAFNDAINDRDLDRLTRLMASDHRFVDAAGSSVEGKEDCGVAWRSFFDAFPDYRNVFDRAVEVAAGRIVVDGRSECSEELLRGPARWYVVVSDGLVVEWRVEDPAG